MSRRAAVGVGCAVAVLLAGCGDDGRLKVYPAGGKLTLDDKPLANAQVWLLPKDKTVFDAPVQVRPQGVTGDDGEFKLSTYLSEDGAPAGEYDVFVIGPGGAGGGDSDNGDLDPAAKKKKGRGPVVPRKYLDAKSSGLSATIVAGTNRLEFALKSR